MNILIVEDELQTANLLKSIIESDSRFQVLGQIDTIVDTVAFINENRKKIDLIFLDIELSDGHSFEIFNHIDIAIPIIFCTAYDEFSLKAIKNNGIDYILKPFKDEDVLNALNKYVSLVDSIQKSKKMFLKSDTITKGYQENFITHYRHKSIVVPSKKIALIVLEFETVYMYTFQNEKYSFHKTMDFIESVCNPNDFFRINRQMLVSKKAVISIEPHGIRKLLVQLSINTVELCVVSRLKVSLFKKWLQKETFI
jgi:DNA-binding LytR/AlgR family response regulator